MPAGNALSERRHSVRVAGAGAQEDRLDTSVQGRQRSAAPPPPRPGRSRRQRAGSGSPARATSAIDGAAVSPRSASQEPLAGSMSKPSTRCPAAMRRSAMARPIRPMPISPTGPSCMVRLPVSRSAVAVRYTGKILPTCKSIGAYSRVGAIRESPNWPPAMQKYMPGGNRSPLRARWGFGGVPPRVNQKRVNQPYQQLNAVEDIALRSHVGRYAGAQGDQGLSLIRSSSIPVRWMQAPDRHALRPGSPATPAEIRARSITWARPPIAS